MSMSIESSIAACVLSVFIFATGGEPQNFSENDPANVYRVNGHKAFSLVGAFEGSISADERSELEALFEAFLFNWKVIFGNPFMFQFYTLDYLEVNGRTEVTFSICQ